jgi:hypothetical protein
MAQKNTHVFDKTFKELMQLSSKAVIQFINALFGTAHPLDSPVSYPNTESVNARGEVRTGDMILQIGDCRYLIECQSRYTEQMIIRIFEYSLLNAWRTRTITEDGRIRLRMPRAMVIYVHAHRDLPEETELELEDSNKTLSRHKIKQIAVLNHSIEDLEQRKLILLLPFQIVKLQKKAKTAETDDEIREIVQELKSLQEEINRVVEKAEEEQLISNGDCGIMQDYLQVLQEEAYSGYTKMEEAGKMTDLRAIRIKWQTLEKEWNEATQSLVEERRLREEAEKKIYELQQKIEDLKNQIPSRIDGRLY